jgi:5-methylcytosine-specific restriction endonuclease McrA
VEKPCTKCKALKPLDDYGPDKRAKDGKQSKCKTCYAEYQEERRKDPELKAADRTRINRATAKRKGYYDELHNEARRRRRKDPAYRAAELDKNRPINRRRYRNDPEYREQAKQRVLQWRLDNPEACRLLHIATENARRARKQGARVAGPVSGKVYAAVLASGPCVYCGAPATCVDHVVPLARDGHEAEYNLAPACDPCNWSKGSKLLAEWDQARVAHAVACSAKVAAALQLAA